jgi:hypothetical protein
MPVMAVSNENQHEQAGDHRSPGTVLTTKLTTNRAHNEGATWTVAHRRPGRTTGVDRSGRVGAS